MEEKFESICLAVCDIARHAGKYIAQERKTFTGEKIEYKGEQNLVSYVDRTSEKMIIDALTKLLPGSTIIAEESASDEPRQALTADQFTWIIDPLDGTTNFTHGLPPYAVSIALMQGDKIVVGVIYEITVGECFYAWLGGPCYLNGQQIEVSKISSIDRSMVVTGLAYKTDDTIEAFARSFNYFNLHSNGARRIGSAATDMAYVAAGRAECFYQKNLSPWDVAAGSLLVQAAGGVVTDYAGGENYIFDGQIIATNTNAGGVFRDKLNELL
ncbi:MAG: inositol monophosphatase family protein [Mucinivorans sp.]